MVAAGMLWGFLPLYWKLLGSVAPMEIVAHRVLWSMLLLAAWLRWRGPWQMPTRRQWGWLALSAITIGMNWFIYIYAVQSGQVLECSLGYFIMPLVSVLLGLLVLKERLSRRRKLAIGLVITAIAFLVQQHGTPPYLALSLAFSFSGYSLVRKQMSMTALNGTLFETMLLTPCALFILGRMLYQEQLAFSAAAPTTTALLIATGVVTTAPLVLSIDASKRLRFTTVGLLQYLAPSIQFLLAVTVFHEPLRLATLLAFTLVWLALILYCSEMFLGSK